MNEKVRNVFAIIGICLIVFILAAVGFFAGRRDSVRSAELELANRELTAAIGSLGAELDHERAVTQRIRIEQAEERSLIAAALGTCRSAGDSVQGVIKKMEVLNDLVRELERRSGRSVDLAGSD